MDVKGTLVLERSSREKVVIEITVRDPGKKGTFSFGRRAPGDVKKFVILTGDQAAVAFATLTEPNIFVRMSRSAPSGASATTSTGGNSIAQVAALTLDVKDSTFSPNSELPGLEPKFRLRAFGPAPASNPAEPGVGVEKDGKKTVALSDIKEADLIRTAGKIGTEQIHFGVGKPGGAIAQFVALGISQDGNVLGFLESEVAGRRTGETLRLHIFPLETLREAKSTEEFLAWDSSDKKSFAEVVREKFGGIQVEENLISREAEINAQRWRSVLRDSAQPPTTLSEEAFQHYLETGSQEKIRSEIDLTVYLGPAPGKNSDLPIVKAAQRCRAVLGVAGT